MANTDMEQQLKEVGKKLLHPPDAVDELLPVLDQVERLLSKVEQSPEKTMLDALKPSMNALIQDDLLRHSDVDVKVAVASCISEITRITAPDAPYDDAQMRDVFQLIVSSFEDLADQSGRNYIKRASILETVSKVRSCVISLDLECDGMIVEMFEHFLRSVKCVTTLTSILHLILCHANRHAVEMLKPLLATVKKHNEGVLPIAQKLGEDVLKKSAEKLKPYLMPALTALGDSLDTYTEIVTRVCDGTTAAMKRDDENASGQQPADESKLAKGSQDETQQVDNEVEKNSTMATIDSYSDSDLKPQKQAGKKAVFTKEVKRPATIALSSDSNLNPQKQAGKKAVFAKDIKRPATIDLSSDSDLNPQKQAGKKAVGTKEIKLPATIDLSADDEATSDSDEEPPPKISKKLEPVKPLKLSAKKGNASTSGDVKSSSKKKDDGRKCASGKNVIKKDEAKTFSSDNDMDVSAKSAKKSAKGEGNLKDTSGTSSKRKRTPVKDKEYDTIKYDESLVGKKVKVWWPEDKEFYEGVIESFDAAKKMHKILYVDGDEEISYLKNQKWAFIQNFSERDKEQTAEVENDDTSGTSAKRKRTPVKDKESDTIKYDESLVGKKVKVWWPEDKEFNEGVIESFDAAMKKHKVLYVSGDEENLYMKNQRWAIIQNFSVRDKEQPAEVESEEASPEIHKKKKSKADPASASQEKNKDSSKKSKASGSKDSKSKAGKSKEAEDTPKPSKGSGETQTRKRTPVKDKESDTIKYDESLVGKKVIVWWPEDKEYYEGVIESFDAAKKKHTVTYVDGDEENLYLRNKKWAIIQNFSARDKESDTIKYDESLVGKKVIVWWPEDKEYYEGVIESFDAAKKKHKVTYVDGDEENLYLKNHKWGIIQNFSARDMEQTAEVESEKDNDDVQVSSPKAIESKSATANISSPSQSDSLPDVSRIKNAVRSKRKQVPQRAGKMAVVAKEVKRPATIYSSSDSDLKPQKQAGKKAVFTKEVKRLATIDPSSDSEY